MSPSSWKREPWSQGLLPHKARMLWCFLLADLVSVSVGHAQQATHDYACGVRAARRVLELHGRHTDFAALFEELQASVSGGVSVGAIVSCLDRRGLHSAVVEGPADVLPQVGLPAVAYTPPSAGESLGHFFVVESATADQVNIWDGYPGLSPATRQALEAPTRVYVLVGQQPLPLRSVATADALLCIISAIGALALLALASPSLVRTIVIRRPVQKGARNHDRKDSLDGG